VLEGSVRKAGDRLRITAQLIDGITGSHLWAERYDRQVVDIFEVQDDITRNVVGAIEPQLYAAENLRIQSEPPESLDAWGCVIRGLWHLGRFTKDDTEQARQLLQQAVALSPRYAKAHSVLAFAEARMLFFGGDIDTTLSTARKVAQVARELDDDDPWSYFSSGYVECFTSRYDDAIAWYRRAIELNENFALAHGNMAAALAFGGQPDAATEAVNRSLRMSPRDPFNFAYLHFAAIAHFAAERYAEGVACEEQALRERPNVSPALRCLAACHVGLGQMDKARDAIAEVLRLVPESSIKRDAYGQVAYARASDRERFAAALREAGLPEGNAAEEDTPPTRPDKPSIAVLPFENMSGDPEQEYFADGISEDITTELSRISEVIVISRNSTFTYKGRAAKVQDVCRDLGVRYVLEGSVRKAGERVRINAQLIDGRSGGHLWAERYDRGLEDIFAVQDDVTEKIVRALEVKLVRGVAAHQAREQVHHPEAYDRVLRGREQYRLFSKESNEAARVLFERAIELDPNYAEPYAGLAETYVQEWFMGTEPSLDRAFELAQQAAAREPTLPFVQEALSTVYLFKKQHAEAIVTARRWIELEPSNADAYATLAGAMHFSGENEEVIALVEKAIRLNPFYPFFYPHYIGMANLAMHRFDEAIAALTRGAVRNPEALWPHVFLAACHGHMGDDDEASGQLAEVRQINPEFSITSLLKLLPYKRSADIDLLLVGLRKAGLPE
jgi:TolB-like protein/Flp pilus assembly protein TadD